MKVKNIVIKFTAVINIIFISTIFYLRIPKTEYEFLRLKEEVRFKGQLSVLAQFDVTSDFNANGTDDIDDADEIQKALDKANDEEISSDDGIIEVYIPAGTYYINNTLRIYKNTSLILAEGATIVNKTIGSNGSIGGKVMLRASHLKDTGEICSSSDCDHYGYSQWKNITITGGTWDFNNSANSHPNGFLLQHGSNLNINNTKLINSTGHTVNVSASQNITISYVTISNQISSEPIKPDNINEAIHLDTADSGEIGYYPNDQTPVKNVIIDYCIFENVLCGIGSHSEYKDDLMGDTITITNNTFTNVACYCVNLFAHKNVIVSGNTAKGYNTKNLISPKNEAYGFVQTYNASVDIQNNTIDNFEYTLVKSNKTSAYSITCNNNCDSNNVSANNFINKFFIVTFFGNGGDGSMPYQKCEYNSNQSKIAKNQFEREGYKFKGWIGFRNYPTEQTYKCDETFNNTTWQTQEVIDANNLTKHIYEDEASIKTAIWQHHAEVQMTAQWTKRTNIEITKSPKLIYTQNSQDLDLTNGEITSTYEDGTTDTISLTNEKVTVTGFDNSEIGTKTLTVDYEGVTTTFDVEIVPKYTVTFYDEDGTTVLGTSTVDYGTNASYTGEAPTKAATQEYTYEFDSWYTSTANDAVVDDLSNVIANRNVYAKYTNTTNKYTVTFYDEDGSSILGTSTVDYGTNASYTGETPTKATTQECTYEFAGWNEANELLNVTENRSVKAKYIVNNDSTTSKDILPQTGNQNIIKPICIGLLFIIYNIIVYYRKNNT